MSEQVTIGPEKVSVTIVRKTHNDLLVSQMSLERWFQTSHEADLAMSATLSVLATKNGDL